MIENLRKYTGGIIIVIALLFVGLAFFGDNAHLGFGNKQNDPVTLEVDSKSYTFLQIKKNGSFGLNLAMQLGLYQSASILGGFQTASNDPVEERFFINRQFLREAREEFGIHPSEDAVAAAIRKMPVFQGLDGQFSQEKYNNFVQGIGRRGMSEPDLLDLVRDDLSIEPLSEILGGGLSSDPKHSIESTASSEQKVGIQIARLDIAAYRDALQPTDEELQKAWEESKDKYMTEKRIKVSWLSLKASYPPAPVDEPAPAEQTEAEKLAATEKKAAAQAAYSEQKRQISNDLAEKADTFLTKLDDQKGEGFETLAAAEGLEVKSTDFFTRAAVPAELNLPIVSSSQSRLQLADYLFQTTKEGSPMERFTEFHRIGEGEWLIARLDEVEEARTKTFEEAKDLVRNDWLQEKAAEALKKDAETKATTIREALAAGKTIAEAGTAAGLTFKAIAPFSRSETVAGETDGPQLFSTASLVKPGSLADPDIRPDSAVFVFVEKREIVRDEARASRATASSNMINQRLKTSALSAWLSSRLARASITRPQGLVSYDR